MHRVFLDKRSQFRAQRFARDEVDRATQQVFQVELHAEIALGGGRPVESHEHVDSTARALAVCLRCVPGQMIFVNVPPREIMNSNGPGLPAARNASATTKRPIW